MKSPNLPSKTNVSLRDFSILRLIFLLLFSTCFLVSCSIENVENSTALETGDEQEFNWRLVMTWPKNYPGLGASVDRFADRVREMSRGQLDITVYGAGELVPALATINAVQSGSVEMGHGAAYYWRGILPVSQFFTNVPFGMVADERNGWLYYGGGIELWRKAYKPLGIIPFPMGNTGTQWAGWFNKEINSAKDLEGLILRMPGFGGEIAASLGAQQVQLSGGEIFTALETGTIDGAEWVGPYNDQTSGFHQITSHYYYPGWHEPGPNLELIVNEESWNTLPKHLQAIVESAAMATSIETHAEYVARNALAYKSLKEQGVNMSPLSPKILAQLKAKTHEKVSQFAQGTELEREVYHSWNTFFQNVKEYRAKAEDYYIEQR